MKSYAGKYIPALGYTIYNANQDPRRTLTINLKGLLIGDGLVDPVNVSCVCVCVHVSVHVQVMSPPPADGWGVP